MVCLKIRKHDITCWISNLSVEVVVWLKIRKHDIPLLLIKIISFVVVWLKIRKHDIEAQQALQSQPGCGLIKD